MSNQAGLQGEMKAIEKEKTRLQAQLDEVTSQKAAAEAKLAEAQKQNRGQVTDAKELKTAKAQLAQLEAEKSRLDPKLIQVKPQQQELKALNPASQPVPSDASGEGLDPAKIIDFVIRKKSQ